MSNEVIMDNLVYEYNGSNSVEESYKEYSEHTDYTEDKGW